jgi:hypothetical protein
VAEPIRVSRRVVAGTGGLAGLLGVLGLAAGGCDSSGHAQPPEATGSGRPGPSRTAAPTPDPTAADAGLRERAIADEQRLLAAAAAPTGAEPFATIRGLHRAHLRVLTGHLPAEPPAAAAPTAATLVTAERALAVARRGDCIAASAELAPLLASLSASADVAVSLLSP